MCNRDRTIPIIAMTANAFKDDEKSALESVMTGFVTKPINVLYLYEVMNKVMDHAK